MRQLFAIAQTQLRLILRHKGYLMLMLVMPIAFTALYAGIVGRSATGRPVPLAVVDNDGGIAARQLMALLAADRTLTIRPADSNQVEGLLADHAVAAGVIIPQGFDEAVATGRAAELQLMTPPGGERRGIEPAVSRAAAQTAANDRLAMALVRSGQAAEMSSAYQRVLAEREAVAVHPAVDTGTGGSPALKERLLGFAILFVMLLVLVLSGGIRRERQDGTWGRMLTAPLRRTVVLSGYLFSYCLVGVCQFTLLATVLALLYRIQWGPLLPLAAMVLATVLCATALGLFLGGLVATAEQQAMMSVIVVVAGSMLGGLYWPVDLMSDTLQLIGHLTPQAWAMDGLRAVVISGGGYAEIARPLAVLLGMTVVFAAAGLGRLRWQEGR